MLYKQDLFSIAERKKPISITLMDEYFKVQSWQEILKIVVDKFSQKNAYLMQKLVDDKDFFYLNKKLFDFDKSQMRSPYKIVKAGVYVELLSNEEAIRTRILLPLFRKYRISGRSIEIEVRKTAQPFDLSTENSTDAGDIDVFWDELENMKLSSTYKPMILYHMLLSSKSLYLDELIEKMTYKYRALKTKYKIIENNANIFLENDCSKISKVLLRMPIKILQSKDIVEYNDTYNLIKIKDEIYNNLNENDIEKAKNMCLDKINIFYENLRNKEIEKIKSKIDNLTKQRSREKQPKRKFELNNRIKELRQELGDRS